MRQVAAPPTRHVSTYPLFKLKYRGETLVFNSAAKFDGDYQLHEARHASFQGVFHVLFFKSERLKKLGIHAFEFREAFPAQSWLIASGDSMSELQLKLTLVALEENFQAKPVEALP